MLKRCCKMIGDTIKTEEFIYKHNLFDPKRIEDIQKFREFISNSRKNIYLNKYNKIKVKILYYWYSLKVVHFMYKHLNKATTSSLCTRYELYYKYIHEVCYLYFYN